MNTLSRAIALVNLERFRIKDEKDLKAGTYIRLFVNHSVDYSGSGIYELSGKPMTLKTYNKQTQESQDEWLRNQLVITVKRNDDWPKHDRVFVSDLIDSANLYKFNSKVLNFIQDGWSNNPAHDSEVFRLYARIIKKKFC